MQTAWKSVMTQAETIDVPKRHDRLSRGNATPDTVTGVPPVDSPVLGDTADILGAGLTMNPGPPDVKSTPLLVISTVTRMVADRAVSHAGVTHDSCVLDMKWAGANAGTCAGVLENLQAS